MASRIEAMQVTVPAGNGSLTPSFYFLPFREGMVSRLEIKVPPGPSGLLGFQIFHSRQCIIPTDNAQWIVADDETLDWQLTGYPTGGLWGLGAYNADLFDHTLYFRFHVDEVGAATAAPITIVPIEQEAPAEDAPVPDLESAPEAVDIPIEDVPEEITV